MNLAHGENEMEVSGLEAAPATVVRPPRVAATLAALECKVTQISQLDDHAGRSIEAFLVLGEVVGVPIDPACLKAGLFDTAAASPLARSGHRGDYAVFGSMLEMLRPAMLPER
jgi:flavin reductase (DIM6/NTAB) family NADH-FMN oxidoreductase RutF